MRFQGSHYYCLDCHDFPLVTNLTFQNAGNPHKTWLTKAGNDVITYRKSSPDDGRTIIDGRTGRRTEPVTRH